MVPYTSPERYLTRDFASRIEPDTSMAVQVNPNNLTGIAMMNVDLRYVIDEAYYYFSPATVLSLIGKYGNLLALWTFSKICTLATQRFGYIAGNPSLIGGLQKVWPKSVANGIAFAERLMDEPSLIRDRGILVRRGFTMPFLEDTLSVTIGDPKIMALLVAACGEIRAPADDGGGNCG